jgi:hypothetical protein
VIERVYGVFWIMKISLKRRSRDPLFSKLSTEFKQSPTEPGIGDFEVQRAKLCILMSERVVHGARSTAPAWAIEKCGHRVTISI